MLRPDAHPKIVEAIKNNKPFAFISSLVFEISSLREELNLLNGEGQEYLPLYIDERFWDASNDESLFTIDRLINAVDECEIIIVILAKTKISEREKNQTPSHVTIADSGSLVTLEGYSNIQEITSVSFWEIELYKLALSQKKVYFIATPNFEPGPYLLQFFDMVPWLNPMIIKTGSLNEIPDLVKKLIKRDKLIENNNYSYFPLLKYQDALAKWKLNSSYSDVFTKQINWGNLNKQNYSKSPNIDLIEKGLLNFTSEPNINHRLTRLWLIYRELYRLPFNDTKYEPFLPLWNDFFNNWSTTAAWYDLHGSIDLGVEFTLNKLEFVREKLRNNPNVIKNYGVLETDYPAGAFASEYYSQAKLFRKKYLYNKALVEIEKGLINKLSGSENLLAIRGSIYLRIFRIDKAIQDYRKSLKIREKNNVSTAKIGEAKTELGFALSLTGVGYISGLKLMKEGLSMMDNNGFKARALRKIARLYPPGSTKKSYLDAAKKISTDLGYAGQLRQILIGGG